MGNQHQTETRMIATRLAGLMVECGIVEHELGLRDFDAPLATLPGVDSMSAVHVLGLIEEEFGVYIPSEMLAFELQTLAAIAAHIAALRPATAA